MPAATQDGARKSRATPAWRGQLTILRHVLAGESAVDLHRLWLNDRQSVERFLRLHQFDTDNPLDVGRLRDLLHEAVEYLSDAFRFEVPDEVAQPAEIHDLFLTASHGPARQRRMACMVLKVMHIQHHIAGRETVFGAKVSEAKLADRLGRRILRVVDQLRASGIDVLEYAGGKKSHASMLTKLLAKRTTLANQIFDRLRFSITVRTRDDLVRTILLLAEEFAPFNYVVPGQSQNGIITLGDVARVLDIEPQIVWEEWTRGRDTPAADGSAPTPPNEFSGRSYRCVNFVADIPMRIDDLMPTATPAIAFAQTEIQLFDEETARANNEGENAHTRYKKRQYARVRARLEGRLGKGGKKAD